MPEDSAGHTRRHVTLTLVDLTTTSSTENKNSNTAGHHISNFFGK